MLIIGLTGSIAMGKSTVAKMLLKNGIPMISADQIVHDLYEDEAVPILEKAFPGSTENNQVNREKLLSLLLKEEDGFKKLEILIHPLVRQKEWEFIKENKDKGSNLVAIEIPLLFETGAEKLMDVVLLASAPAEVQKQRVMARPGMTTEKFKTLLAKQMPDAEKRKKADFIVDTSCSLSETEDQLKEIIVLLKNKQPKAYDLWLQIEDAL
ncbi:MAG: dephospho-CoA kinase [Methyloligella sp.]|nr:MAG: dephospho-CoA kinase [Methyloligella sp.]